MEAHPSLILLLLLSCFAASSYAHNVRFSNLNHSLIVTVSTTPGQVLRAGEDQVTITWLYNTSYPGSDTNYTTVEAWLCYAPVSQAGRDDRKTDNNLDNDKTCPFEITDGPYRRSNNSFVWTVPRDIPTATYFVRVYALRSKDHETAYGESTDALKTTNLFQVNGTVSNQEVSAAVMIGGFFWVWVCMASYVISCVHLM